MSNQYNLTANAGQYTEPVSIISNTKVTATNGYIEWAPNSLEDYKNNVVVWQTWPVGADGGSAISLNEMIVRLVGVSAGASAVIDQGNNTSVTFGPTPLNAYWLVGASMYGIDGGVLAAGLNEAQIANGATGVPGLDEDSALILGDGSKKIGNSIKRQNIGTRILSCRMGTLDNTTQKTFRSVIELAVKGADAWRPIFANAAATSYTIGACNGRSIPNIAALTSLPSPTAITLTNSGVVPAGKVTNLRPTLYVPEWLLLPTVERDDGGIGALVVIDGYISTSGVISVLGNGSNDVFTGWATRANRKWIMRMNNGDCVTTPSNFTSTANVNQSPIVGVQYIARGKVLTVLGPGNSIEDGRGTLIGEGFGVPACEQASDDEIALEWANRGWAGGQVQNFSHFLQDFIDDTGTVPDIVVHPNATPNSLSNTIVPADIIYNRSNISRLTLTASKYGIYQIPWTVLPTNPVQKPYGASDSLRVAYNEEWLNNYAMPVMDFATVLSGPVVSGQVTMLPGSTTDNIHPNDTGNALLTPLLASELLKIKYW